MDVMESKYMLGVMCFATVWALFAVDLLILCGVAKSVRQLQSLHACQRLRPTDTTITGARVAQGDPVIYSISFIVFILFFTEWSVLSIFQNQPEDRQVNRRSGSICSQCEPAGPQQQPPALSDRANEAHAAVLLALLRSIGLPASFLQLLLIVLLLRRSDCDAVPNP